MQISELFETRVEDKIEPVIKVGETADAHSAIARLAIS